MQPSDSLRKRVTQKLIDSDITPTRQRVEIGLCLFDQDRHITADQLLEQVNKSSSEASKATIYNTLGLFAEKGLVREVIVDPNKVVYDTNTSEHHHIYNESTGLLSDVSTSDVQLVGLPTLASGIDITGIDIIIRVQNSDITDS